MNDIRKKRFGVAVKKGTFTATVTIGKQTEYIGPQRPSMSDAVLDIPEGQRGAYERWV